VPSSLLTFQPTLSPTFSVVGAGEANLGTGLDECKIRRRASSYRSRSGGTGNGADSATDDVGGVGVLMTIALGVATGVVVIAAVDVGVGSGVVVGAGEPLHALTTNSRSINTGTALMAGLIKSVDCCVIRLGLGPVRLYALNLFMALSMPSAITDSTASAARVDALRTRSRSCGGILPST
jgi:hypothetical protein